LFKTLRKEILDQHSTLKHTILILSKYIHHPLQLQSIIDIKTLPILIPFIHQPITTHQLDSQNILSHSPTLNQHNSGLSPTLQSLSDIICNHLYHQNNSKEDGFELIKVLKHYFMDNLSTHLQKSLEVWSNKRLINILSWSETSTNKSRI